MKKLLALVLIIVCLTATATAETNLSKMTYETLLNLQRQLVIEIMSREEWKEVKVPSGHWRIGDDIPAGTYCIKAAIHSCYLRIWGKDYEDRDSNGGLIFHQVVEAENDIGKIELKKGWLLDIDDAILLTPPALLGF